MNIFQNYDIDRMSYFEPFGMAKNVDYNDSGRLYIYTTLFLVTILRLI